MIRSRHRRGGNNEKDPMTDKLPVNIKDNTFDQDRIARSSYDDYGVKPSDNGDSSSDEEKKEEEEPKGGRRRRRTLRIPKGVHVKAKTLKRMLKSKGLKTTGKKSTLRSRARKAHLIRGGGK